MPSQTAIQGAYSALLMPLDASGALDEAAWDRLLATSLDAGLQGVVVAGGTGEYAAVSADLRLQSTKLAVERCKGKAQVIAAIGAAYLDDAVALGEASRELGADALLLPGPHFYRYEQSDLHDFFRAASQRLNTPVLIYNLAAFVTPMAPDTALRLLEECPNLVGIKDSSGSPEILERLTESGYPGARILGHDRVLARLLRADGLNGLISGPAGVIPEFAAALFRTQESDARDRLLAHYDEFLDQHDQFPYPYALKWIAAARGLITPRYPVSLSTERSQQRDAFQQWFADWHVRLKHLLNGSVGP